MDWFLYDRDLCYEKVKGIWEWTVDLKILKYIMLHREKYRNFTWFPGMEILRKGTVSA